jgi:DNA-binding CsgD family transcriptional regulator
MSELATRLVERIDGDPVAGLRRLDAEADNLRLALDRHAEVDALQAIRLWSALRPFWDSRGRLREGIARFEQLRDRAGEPSAELARAMTDYAIRIAWIADRAATRAATMAALDVAQRAEDRAQQVWCLAILATAAFNDGDRGLAEQVGSMLTSLEPQLEAPVDRMNAAEARAHVAGTRHGYASEEAVRALREAVARAREADLPRREMTMAGNLAIAQLHRADFRAAVPFAERSVEIARALNHQLLWWALSTLSMALAGAGSTERAVATLREASSEALASGAPTATQQVLLAAMPVAVAAGRPLVAARSWGAVKALEVSGGIAVSPDDRRLAERTLDRVRRRSPALGFELAVRDGAGADRADLLRTLPDALARRSGQAPVPPSLRHGELTTRELEILGLVGQGMTDPEIARALFISPKTASVHVANVKAKLGARSRLDVALRARELGLVAEDSTRATGLDDPP